MTSTDPPSSANQSAPAAAERINTKAAGIVGLAVMCSRVLGLIREQIFAALFGGGREMDIFTAAFRIPNLLRDLFAEGALSAAFVTTFTKTNVTQGHDAAWRLANKVATLTVVVLSLICLLSIWAAPAIVGFLAPGFDPAKAEMTVTLVRIMFPFILLVSLAALVMGMLNARNVFGVPAMASSFFNLGSIIGGALLGWWMDPHFGERALIGLSLGTLVGGLMQFVVQVPALWRLGYRFRPDFVWRDEGVRNILRLMGPAVIAASSVQVNVMVNSMFASTLGDGPIAWLAYAFRLMQLPLGIFGVALGTVALPALARMVAQQRLDDFQSELARAMRLMFVLTVPSTIGLIVLAEPIMSVLYQHGKLTAYQAGQAAAALQMYALGLCAYAAMKVLVNAFYAIDKRRTPMVVSLLAIGLNLVFSWLFTTKLGLGHRGLALSTACVATLNFTLLYVLMRHRLKSLHSGLLLATLGKLAVAGAVLALVAWTGKQWLLADWATQAFVSKTVALFGTIAAAGGAFVLAAWLLKVEEIRAIAQVVQRRLSR